MRRVKSVGLLTALALAVTAAACGDDSDGDDETATDQTTIEESTSTTGGSEGGGDDEGCTAERVGGSITVAPGAVGTTLDPYSSPGGSAKTGLEELAIYDSLVRYDTSTGEFVGQLAESIEPNEDASVWTLHLREGVEFGNGDPFDAAAVKASIDRHIDPAGTSRLRSAGQLIQTVEAVDPLTVQITLKEPWGFFPVHLAAGGGTVGSLGMIQNVALIDEVGADAFAQSPVGGGAGAYEIAEWSPPERVVLQAKDDWWGGPVCIEEITFTQLPATQARFDGLELGELDVITLTRDPVLIEAANEAFNEVTVIDHGNMQIEFNHANPEFADLRTRQAVAYAIDPTVVDERAFEGLGLPSTGLVHEESEVLEATHGLEYDPERAQELVDELKAEGMTLEFELLAADQASNIEAALAIEALLEAVGFTITTNFQPQAAAQTLVYGDRNFDFWLGGMVGTEPTLFSSLYKFDSRNPANPYGFADPAMDTALEDLRGATGTDELQVAIDALQEVWNDTVTAVVYASDRSGVYWSDRVHGLYFTQGVTPFFDSAYIEE